MRLPQSISHGGAVRVLLATTAPAVLPWRAARAEGAYYGPLVDAHAHLRVIAEFSNVARSTFEDMEAAIDEQPYGWLQVVVVRRERDKYELTRSPGDC